MNEADKKKSFFDKLRDTYRLSMLNDETYEEVGSFKFSYLGIILSVLGFLIIVSFLTFLLISYTPIRYYIPGYGSIESDKTYIRMKQRLDEMEKYIDDVNVYTENMKKMLKGETESIEDMELGSPSLEKSQKVERIPEDDSLRSKIDINRDLALLAQSAGSSETQIENIDEMYLIPPVKGYISAAYNPENNHFGIDIIAPENSNIKAVAPGVVILAENSLETGHTIGIQHPNDLVTYYKHNSSLLKKMGEYVQEGEAIAIIGNTGELTTGPHLHFEMWYKGQNLNPGRYVETIK